MQRELLQERGLPELQVQLRERAEEVSCLSERLSDICLHRCRKLYICRSR